VLVFTLCSSVIFIYNMFLGLAKSFYKCLVANTAAYKVYTIARSNTLMYITERECPLCSKQSQCMMSPGQLDRLHVQDEWLQQQGCDQVARGNKK